MARLRALLTEDLDAFAGALGAFAVLALYFLGVGGSEALSAAAVGTVAVVLVRDLRRRPRQVHAEDLLARAARGVAAIEASLLPSDVVLSGPTRVRGVVESFVRTARGELTCYNLGPKAFAPARLLELVLRPAVENPAVTSVQFVLDEGERARWRAEVLPKVVALRGRGKVREPRWCAFETAVSFIVAETRAGRGPEACLFLGAEPFAAAEDDEGGIPRYVLHVQPGSELAAELAEVARGRLDGRALA